MKISKEFLLSTAVIFSSFFILQLLVIPSVYKDSLTAQVTQTSQFGAPVINNIYKLKPTDIPGVYDFEYFFISPTSLPSEIKKFDANILPFDNNIASDILKYHYNIEDATFGDIRDQNNYPVGFNAFMEVDDRVAKMDQDPNNPAIYNCRRNTAVAGYFKAYFEDVQLNNGQGFAHPTFGAERIRVACQVLQDISELIKLDQTNVTPDILFVRANLNMPMDVLASAHNLFRGLNADAPPDNGFIHRHIISHKDPSPQNGAFDGRISINFNIPWDVDSTLNPSTYSFSTVLSHEVFHLLGFLSRRKETTVNNTDTYTTLDYFMYQNTNATNPFVGRLTGLLNPVNWPTGGNQAVYKGSWFFPNAALNHHHDVRPIFSPAIWQNGSSLSHFDHSRNGEAYSMHPELPPNTVTPIHIHEKEALCHMGYAVKDFDGQFATPDMSCRFPAPFAEDDIIAFPEFPTEVCVKPLANDRIVFPLNGYITMETLNLDNLLGGDVVTLYADDNCQTPRNFLNSVNHSTGQARSFKIVFGNSTSPRILKYSIREFGTNRMSNMAWIKILSCNNNPLEYVCNGDFESGLISYHAHNSRHSNNFIGSFVCSFGWDLFYKIPFWCNSSGSPDLKTLTGDGSLFSAFNWVVSTPPRDQRPHFIDGEGILTELKRPLDPNKEYKISFDVLVLSRSNNSSGSINLIAQIGTGLGNNLFSPNIHILPPSSLLNNQVVLNRSFTSGFNNTNWVRVESIFTPTHPHVFLGIHPDIPNPDKSFKYSPNDIYIDNVSIKSVVKTPDVIPGCKDPEALNYDPNSMFEIEGMCIYNETDEPYDVMLFKHLVSDTPRTSSDPRLLRFEVGLTNNETFPIQGAIIYDPVPTGLTLYRMITNPPTVASYLSSGHLFIQNSIASGQTVSVYFDFAIPDTDICGTRTNTATLLAVDETMIFPSTVLVVSVSANLNSNPNQPCEIDQKPGPVTRPGNGPGPGPSTPGLIKRTGQKILDLFRKKERDQDVIIGILRIQHSTEFDPETDMIVARGEYFYLEKSNGKFFEISDTENIDESLSGLEVIYNKQDGTITPTGKSPEVSRAKSGDRETLNTAIFLVRFDNSQPIVGDPVAGDFKDLFFTGANTSYLTRFYGEMTHGKVNIIGDVFDWYTLPGNGGDYNLPPYYPCFVPGAKIQEIATHHRVNLSGYDRVVLITNCADYHTIGGAFFFPSNTAHNGTGVPLIRTVGNHDRLRINNFGGYGTFGNVVWNIVHEMGHSFSDVSHSNALDCGEKTIWTGCSNIEYGNSFDVMGKGRIFNAWRQKNNGWIDENNILEIRQAGDYFINNLQTEDGIVGAQIYIEGLEYPVFSVEHRKATGFDSNLRANPRNGLLLYSNIIRSQSSFPLRSGITQSLVDPHPTQTEFVADTINDAITVSDPFYDEVFGIGITVSSVTPEGINFTVTYSNAMTRTISGIVYEDLNLDGEYQTGEPLLENKTIALYHTTDITPDSTTTTNSAGEYTFVNAPNPSVIALLDESPYSQITQPAYDPLLLVNQFYPYMIDGSNDVHLDKNFGVVTNPQPLSVNLAKRVSDYDILGPEPNVTFRLDITNTSNRDLTNIVVKDRIPNRLTYYSSRGIPGTSPSLYDQTTEEWKIPNLPAGQTSSIHIVMMIKSTACGIITNTATLLSADQQFVPTEISADFPTGRTCFNLIDRIQNLFCILTGNCGKITIIQDTVPDDRQPFTFTQDINPAIGNFFYLDDDGSLSNPSPIPNTVTFTVRAGTYNVTQEPISQYNVNVICTDPTNDTIVSGNRATINLSARENITCTFTNNKLPDDPLACIPDTWTRKADLPGVPRGNAMAFAVSDKGYVTQGADISWNRLNEVYEYNPVNNTWTQKADFPGPGRWEGASFAIDNKGYITSGQLQSSLYTNDLWEYDQIADSWTQKSSIPGVERNWPIAFSIGNKGYVGLGNQQQGNNFADFWEWDQSTNTWTQKADFPSTNQRLGLMGFAIRTKGYVGGGWSSIGGIYYDDFYEYDSVGNIWTQKASFPGGSREQPNSGNFVIGNFGYVSTGRGVVNSSLFYYSDLWRYDPTTDTWAMMANLPAPGRVGAISFSINNKGYMGLGFMSNNNAINDFWEYCPAE